MKKITFMAIAMGMFAFTACHRQRRKLQHLNLVVESNYRFCCSAEACR